MKLTVIISEEDELQYDVKPIIMFCAWGTIMNVYELQWTIMNFNEPRKLKINHNQYVQQS